MSRRPLRVLELRSVRGTGGGLEPIRNIAHPLAFRSHITAA